MQGRLPDFLVIGAPRAGTTALAKYLGDHPQVFMSARKELQFFDIRYETTPIEWYRSHFADAAPGAKAGEASPLYLFYPHAHARMADVVPDAKLVAILRNPVDRAWSHYWFRRGWRVEKRPFDKAISDEIDGRAPPGAEYLAIGRYAAQLAHLERYYSPSRLLVLVFDDLVTDPVATFQTVCGHIGVDASAVPDVVGERINPAYGVRSLTLRRALRRYRERAGRVGGAARRIDRLNAVRLKTRQVDPALRHRLIEMFTDANAELAARLDRDLSAWNS